jgi:glycerate 2-kinase
MNVLIAPNSMKGSLSADQFAKIVGQAFRDTDSSFFEIRKVPVADGGDQTSDILIKALNLISHEAKVNDPLGRSVNAIFGYANGLAVIEMAKASGLKLLDQNELNPLTTSSYGTGQLILEAIKLGAKTIYVGIGGSATVDGGLGILEALDVKFYDSNGTILTGNGGNLIKIAKIDFNNLKKLNGLKIKVICDVKNPLLGENGAARIFAPQKGATNEMVKLLELGLKNFTEITQRTTKKSIALFKGGGAAGGVAAGMAAYLDAEIVSGADFILDILSFDEHVQWADLVITGEGKIDNQTFCEKAPYAVAQRAKKYGKKVIGIAGSIEPLRQNLFDGCFSVINKPCKHSQAMDEADILVFNTAKELARLIYAICSNGNINPIYLKNNVQLNDIN